MKIWAYSLYDKKLQRSNYPFYARSDQEAVLIVTRSNPPKSLYDDLELKKHFEFDDETLQITLTPGIVPLPPLFKEGDQNV